MYLIKIGGSVITDKSTEDAFKKDIMDNLSKQIKESKKETLIIHGAGSFGHILADRYQLNLGYNKAEQLNGFSKTLEKVQTLNTYVLRSLQKQNLPAISIPPHTVLMLDDHKLDRIDYEIFEKYLDKKFLPVTYGDVVLDENLGFSICSGDLIMIALAKHFKPEKVIFVIDEDGLYTSKTKIDKNAEFIEETSIKELEKLSTKLDDHSDVTGGMKGKIETIKQISKEGIDTILLNGNKPDSLYNVLIGEETKKTIIYGEIEWIKPNQEKMIT